jgi:hypothetical protein
MSRTTAACLFVAALCSWPAKGRADEESSLGKLSEKYESGGRGPGTVSTGRGDPGGVSYGTYQLASKLGRADEFVKRYYPDEFKGLKGGTDVFTRKWKELGDKDPAGLRKNEHAFIRETHYEPQVAKLAKELGLDVTKRSAALRDVVWSTAVQHGPNTDVIVVAARSLLKNGTKIEAVSDEALIRAIYAERGRKTADGKLARFKGVSDDWIPGLTKRFENELADALAMLNRGMGFQPMRPHRQDAHLGRAVSHVSSHGLEGLDGRAQTSLPAGGIARACVILRSARRCSPLLLHIPPCPRC